MKPASYYLKLVQDWEDPNPAPKIEQHDNVYIVRDDLLEYGSKIRFLDFYVRNSKHKELVYGSSPAYGYAQISLGYLCKKYNKTCVLFQAGRKELHPYQQRALQLGVVFHFAKMGMLTVTESRAKKYVEEDIENRIYLPMGLEHETAFGSIIKVTSKLDIKPDHIWVASSSGTLARGLKLSFPDSIVHCVSVGHKMSERELGGNQIHLSSYAFNKEIKAKEAPPYPSAPNYDAKVWPVLQEYLKNNKEGKHLVWNVGA